MKREFILIRRVIPLVLLPFACAKVTTSYPSGEDGSAMGSAGSTAVEGEGTGGYPASFTIGGATSTGGMKATGGVVGTGGAKATGGTTAVVGTAGTTAVVGTGGATVVVGAGGTSATGGTTTTGSAGDVGTSCATGFAFCDDFEANTVGGPAAGWTSTTGTWSVTTDTTATPGDQKVYSNTTTGNASSQAGTGTYTNASIEARIKVTSFSSTSASNSAGIFLRSNGTNDYDLSLGGDGIVYLRRTPTSSTGETCSTGANASAGSEVTVTTSGSGWFRLKLVVSGTVATGITITGYVDPTGSSGYTQVLQCTQTGTSYMYDSGTAGVFSKGNAPAEYDNVIISTL